MLTILCLPSLLPFQQLFSFIELFLPFY